VPSFILYIFLPKDKKLPSDGLFGLDGGYPSDLIFERHYLPTSQSFGKKTKAQYGGFYF